MPAVPFGAAKKVLAVCDAKLLGVTDNVPPSVILPLVVTVPDNDRPETVPVPVTLVTVPVVDDVPAPIAVRNVAASSIETVLSALTRGKVIAEGSPEEVAGVKASYTGKFLKEVLKKTRGLNPTVMNG